MVYIFTQRDPFFIDTFIYKFDEFGVKYVLFNFPNFNKGIRYGIKRSIQLYGILGFFKLLFIFLSEKPFRKIKNAKKILNLTKMSEIEPYLSDISDDDIVLSLSAPTRIPVEKMPKKSLKINFHCGKLPEYSGMMPIFWQVYNKEKNIIITAHNMSEKIDEGKIILEREVKIEGSFFNLSRKAKSISAELFKEIIENRKSFSQSNLRDRKDLKLNKFPKKNEIKKIKEIIKLI